MATKRIAEVDSGSKIQVNVVNQSPHVVAYKIWVKVPGTDWLAVGEGQTADDIADFYNLGPYPKGTLLDYWFGIGGNARTAWSALLSIAQGGHIVPGGSVGESGTTDATGIDVRETEVRFV
ncbi:MAG TPA: hypothetical protein VFU03_04245 [Gemmatimonadales bacterium]|nr:hypothetical protein [Gemmatimonadales bacterium]